MFTSVARKYDIVNSVLSFGIHHLWKRRLIFESGVQPGWHVLDCATGTGDIAFLFESALKKTGKVVAGDFCISMLEVAKQKAKERNSFIQFELADLMNLHYSNHTFDIASVSFGIRNVLDPKKAFCELGRVVKPKGSVLILEFGQPKLPGFSQIYRFYSKWALPYLGGLLSGARDAYRYLESSSHSFPCGQALLDLGMSTGVFSKSRFLSFQAGIAFLYIFEVA